MIRLMLGIGLAVAVGIAVTTNAVFMLFSPRAWFGLPAWFRLGSRYSEKRHGGFWGNVRIRLIGAILLAIMAWIVHITYSRGQ